MTTQSTSNIVPATVSVPATLATTIRNLGIDARKGDDVATTGYSKTVAYCFPTGKSASFDASRFDACRLIFVEGYTSGLTPTTAKDVKAGKGKQADATVYDAAKRRARSRFGMGTNRAMQDAGLERPTQNPGGRKAATPATPATVESTAVLPPAFVTGMQAHKADLAQFQAHFGAKLTVPGKEALGKMSAHFATLLGMLEPSPTGAGTPPEGTPQNPGSK